MRLCPIRTVLLVFGLLALEFRGALFQLLFEQRDCGGLAGKAGIATATNEANQTLTKLEAQRAEAVKDGQPTAKIDSKLTAARHAKKWNAK